MRCFGQTGYYVQHHFCILSSFGNFKKIVRDRFPFYRNCGCVTFIYKGSFFKLMTYNAHGLLEAAQLFVELKVLKRAAFIKLNVMRCLVLSEDTPCAFRNFLALI